MSDNREFVMPRVHTVEDDGTVNSVGSQSSAASGYFHHGPVTFGDLIDLTSPSTCRVILSGKQSRRVCSAGVPCSKKAHPTIGLEPGRRAAPGWYVWCPGPNGTRDGNGRERVFTTEEARALQQQELYEQAAALADLERGGSTDASFQTTGSTAVRAVQDHVASLRDLGDPDESVGASFHVEFEPQGATAPGDPFSPTARTPGISNTKTNTTTGGGRGPSVQGGSTSQRGFQPGQPTTWYGLENAATGDRFATKEEDKARFLSTAGWDVRRIFDNKPEADAWVASATPRNRPPVPQPVSTAPPAVAHSPVPAPPQASSPSPALALLTSQGGGGTTTPQAGVGSTTPKPLFGLEHPAHGDRTIARSRADADILTESGFVIKKLFYDLDEAEKWANQGGGGPSLRPGTTSGRHVRKTGTDKSASTQEVFEVNINRFDDMDTMMLPAGTPLEVADEYYDCAADVLALPGGYRSLDRDDDAADDSMAVAMLAMMKSSKQTGMHVRYGAPKYNGLSRIKTGEDLPDFMDKLNDTYDTAEEGMVSQFTRKMHAAGHSPDSIEDYLQNGVLPRVVRDTYRFYGMLLNTLAGYVSQLAPGQPWDTSIGKLLLKHHLDQLGLIRESSPSYRDLVLRNYSYLRKQHSTSFWNDKLSKKAALLTNKLVTSPRPSGRGPREAAGSEGDGDKCSTCHRKHSGQPPCPTTPLTRSERTQLGAGLGQRKYERALKSIKQTFGANSQADHAEAIETARQAANA